MLDKLPTAEVLVGCGHVLILGGRLEDMKEGFESLDCATCFTRKQFAKIGLSVAHLGDLAKMDWSRPWPAKCQRCGVEVLVSVESVIGHPGCPECQTD